MMNKKVQDFLKDRLGFTLIELLAVVGIIAVLYIVLAPRLGGGEDSARMAGVQSDFRNIQMGKTNYMSVKPPALREFNVPDYAGETLTAAANRSNNASDFFRINQSQIDNDDAALDVVGTNFGDFDRQTIETYIDRALLADADITVGQGDPWGRRYRFTDITPVGVNMPQTFIDLNVTLGDLGGRYLLVWSAGPDNKNTVPIVLQDEDSLDVTSGALTVDFVDPSTFRPNVARIQDIDNASKQLWLLLYIGRNNQISSVPELSQVRFEEKVSEARTNTLSDAPQHRYIIGPTGN